MDLIIKTPAWAVPILESEDVRYIGAHGGRGSGKSHFFAEYIIEQSFMRKIDVVCVREIQKSLARSVKKLLESKIESLGVGHAFDVQKSVIKSSHGGVIIFQGLQDHTAESIKSLEGFDIAWIEEAQSISSFSLGLLRPTIRKPGSRIMATWNPRSNKDPIERLLRTDNPPSSSVVVEAHYEDNPWFPDVLREEMEYDRSRDPDKYAHVWRGKYLEMSEARVFRNWRIEEFETPDDATFVYGADWGFSIDPTVLLRMFENKEERKLYIDYEAYKIGCEIDHLPALFDTVPDARKWTITADNARPETISYMKRQGFKIRSSKKGKGSVEDGVEFLKSYDIIVHPRCKHVVDELMYYSYKIDSHTEEVLPVLKDAYNHCLVGETLVDTIDGQMPIKDLVRKEGYVHSIDPETLKPCVKKFSDVRLTREDAEIYRIEMNDGRYIDLTGDHLVLTKRGWIEAQHLTDEDFIVDMLQ